MPSSAADARAVSVANRRHDAVLDPDRADRALVAATDARGVKIALGRRLAARNRHIDGARRLLAGADAGGGASARRGHGAARDLYGAAGRLVAAADAGGGASARRGHGAARDLDFPGRFGGPAADAGRLAAARGGNRSAGNRDVAARAGVAAADGRAGLAAGRRHGGVAGNPDGAALAFASAADARAVRPALGLDVAARDGDGGAVALLAAADAGAIGAALCLNRSAGDGDGAAVRAMAAADAGTAGAAGGGHAAARNRDVPAVAARSVLAGGAADARALFAALRMDFAAEDANRAAAAGAVAAAVVPGRAAADARGIHAAGGRHMSAVNCDVAAVAAVAAVHSVYRAAAADARAGRAALRNHRCVADEHSAASGPVATADARAALDASRVDCAAEDRDRAARAAGAAADAGGPGAACRAQRAVAGNRERVARGHPDARIALAGGDRGFPVERHRHGVVAVEEKRAGSYVRIHAKNQVLEFDFARRLHPHAHLALDVRAGERVVRRVREVEVQAIPILPALALESRDIDAVHGHARSPDGRVDIGARNDGAVGFAAFADVHDETVVAIRKPDVDLAAIVGIDVVVAVGSDICVVEPLQGDAGVGIEAGDGHAVADAVVVGGLRRGDASDPDRAAVDFYLVAGRRVFGADSDSGMTRGHGDRAAGDRHQAGVRIASAADARAVAVAGGGHYAAGNDGRAAIVRARAAVAGADAGALLADRGHRAAENPRRAAGGPIAAADAGAKAPGVHRSAGNLHNAALAASAAADAGGVAVGTGSDSAATECDGPRLLPVSAADAGAAVNAGAVGAHIVLVSGDCLKRALAGDGRHGAFWNLEGCVPALGGLERALADERKVDRCAWSDADRMRARSGGEIYREVRKRHCAVVRRRDADAGGRASANGERPGVREEYGVVFVPVPARSCGMASVDLVDQEARRDKWNRLAVCAVDADDPLLRAGRGERRKGVGAVGKP